MRAFMVLVVLVLAVVVLVGYERGWFVISTASNDHAADVNARVDKDQWRKDRDAFHQQSDTRLKDLERQLDELKAKAKQADAASRVKLNQAVDELNSKYQAAREELREFGNSTQEHWETTKTKLGQALDDLKKGVDKAASRFQ